MGKSVSKIYFISIFLILSFSFVSAGFFSDFFDGITGRVIGDVTCTDSDDGKDFFDDDLTRLKTSYFIRGNVELVSPTGVEIYDDFCTNDMNDPDSNIVEEGTYLIENICKEDSSGNLIRDFVVYDRGCKDGFRTLTSSCVVNGFICEADEMCDWGFCVPLPEGSCIDYDITEEFPDGKNYFTKGKTFGSDGYNEPGNFTDYCLDSPYDFGSRDYPTNFVLENFCDEKEERSYEVYECPDNFVCDDGACMEILEECVPETCSSLNKECGSFANHCGGYLDCGECSEGEGCRYGICIVKEEDYCIDGDGDLSLEESYYVKEDVIHANMHTFYKPEVVSDGCRDTGNIGDYGILIEGRCDGLNYAQSTYTCPNGCNDGACLLEECVPKTCLNYGYNCGIWKDGCGRYLDCGNCIGGEECRSGVCVEEKMEEKESVAIFIDQQTYLDLKYEIDRLKEDISKDLDSQVFLFSGYWEDIGEIKNILIEKYQNAGLIGVILIGEIPTAYFEYQDSGLTPTDWYFQDLSDSYVDSDRDGIFEREYFLTETDITKRDIWAGRIKSPVSGQEGIRLLKAYFDRNHDYRTGALTYNEEMLYFGSIAVNQNEISQEDHNNFINEIGNFIGFYNSDSDIVSIYDNDIEKMKDDYLSELSKNRDFVFMNIHGLPTSQWLGGSTFVDYNEIRNSSPGSLFTVMASCSNGDFTKENYFAGWYLFSGNSLVVMANSVVTMLVGGTEVRFLQDYLPLGLGVTFGDISKNDRSFLVTQLFGDPTLTLREKPIGNIPKLKVSATALNYGGVEKGSKPLQNILFTNEGTEVLKIVRQKVVSTINGEYAELGYWDLFYYEHPDTGLTFRSFEVSPGETKTVPFVFYPREDGPSGEYTMSMLFQTNDPNNPYLEIKLAGHTEVAEVYRELDNSGSDGTYYNPNGDILPQLSGGEACEHDSECKSSSCVDSVCLEAVFFRKFLNWFSRFFN